MFVGRNPKRINRQSLHRSKSAACAEGMNCLLAETLRVAMHKNREGLPCSYDDIASAMLGLQRTPYYPKHDLGAARYVALHSHKTRLLILAPEANAPLGLSRFITTLLIPFWPGHITVCGMQSTDVPDSIVQFEQGYCFEITYAF